MEPSLETEQRLAAEAAAAAQVRSCLPTAHLSTATASVKVVAMPCTLPSAD